MLGCAFTVFSVHGAADEKSGPKKLVEKCDESEGLENEVGLWRHFLRLLRFSFCLQKLTDEFCRLKNSLLLCLTLICAAILRQTVAKSGEWRSFLVF
jgi:hypothetical protein